MSATTIFPSVTPQQYGLLIAKAGDAGIVFAGGVAHARGCVISISYPLAGAPINARAVADLAITVQSAPRSEAAKVMNEMISDLFEATIGQEFYADFTPSTAPATPAEKS